jgi:predicted metal-dependent peptidase
MAVVKKGQFVLVDPESVKDQGKPGDKKDKPATSSPTELETPPDDVETPDFDPNAKTGPGYERTLTGKAGKSTKTYKSKKALGKGGNKTQIADFWNKAMASAMSSSSNKLSEKARQLIKEMGSNKPKVNWKRELKKFLDQAMNQFDIVLPNRRFLGSGDVLYGRKRVGQDTLKTLVLPVDTSGSISKAQIKVFFEEVWSLSTKLDIDKTIIIYCSDDIDAVDVVKKGQKPDLSKWASTGGNSKGFDPPFAYIEKNKIVPSAVIYLTDSFASYPSASKYGIDKYKKRVFWFICNSTSNFDKPPFGKYIHIPMDQQGNFL